jgi:tRNA/rRNA methyltransferase
MKPAFILAAPQMGENIGAVARAMANFGLSDLRLVAPRDGWPNRRAVETAKHAAHVAENAMCVRTLPEAAEGVRAVYAVTARMRDLELPVLSPAEAAKEAASYAASGLKTAFLFGRERDGLTNEEVASANALVTIPAADYSSLNLAQAACVVAYELFLAAGNGLALSLTSAPAPSEEMRVFLEKLDVLLDERGFFRVPEKRESIRHRLRAYFLRSRPTEQELRMLHGAVRVLARGRG